MRDRRVVALAMLVAACTAASVVYVARGGVRGDERQLPDPDAGAPRLSGGGTIVFRNIDPARPAQFGLTGVTRLRDLQPLPCGRLHVAGGRGLCLEPPHRVLRQRVTVLGRRLQPLGQLTLQGIPTRARVSGDGRYGAVTFFVYGHSYADPGTFSTQTTLIDLAARKALGDLEQFRVTRDGDEFDSPDFNFWGVTFAEDSDRFYATLSSRGRTYLVEGSVSRRRARVLREGVECPSLSPDGTRLAFKKRVGKGAQWRLHVLDLATLRERPLAETRSVDDQAEWLDDGHVLYGLNGAVWVVRADGRGTPRRLLRWADSPAVVRPAA